MNGLYTPPRSSSPASPRLDPAKLDALPRLSRRRIRSVVMRAGTSKGLFFRQEDLPADREEWHEIITTAMGSPDAYMKQLNGMGGGVSTQSKVAVVGRSSDPRADVDYTFIQVPIDGGPLDFSGNCGNMASGVGPFAVDENLFSVDSDDLHEVTVRVRNTNTNRIIHSTFAVEDRFPVEFGELKLDGVSGAGSPIRLDFLDPAGCMTGKLLPTGSAINHITVPFRDTMTTFTVSCIDAANPFVFVYRDELGLSGQETLAHVQAETTDVLMSIRARAAVLMGLASSPEAARLVMGTPKIAIVGGPIDYTTSAGRSVSSDEQDIWVRPFSMGKPHPALQMTGAVCMAAAAAVPGSIVHSIASRSRLQSGKTSSAPLLIGHGAGTMATDSDAIVSEEGSVDVRRGSVYRTARRLMEGYVLYSKS